MHTSGEIIEDFIIMIDHSMCYFNQIKPVTLKLIFYVWGFQFLAFY